MGYVIFQSRKENHSVLLSHRLEDSTNNSDELIGFLPGDTIELCLTIGQQLAQNYKAKGSKASNSRIKTNPSIEQTIYEVCLFFQIIKRVHHVSRDWMSQYKMGFRSIGTTIYLEPFSDEDEDIFVEVQGEFDVLLKNIFDTEILANVMQTQDNKE